MRFAVYQLSRKGGREKNEDRVGYTYTRDAGLFALADGMGGHPEGDVAAQLALQTLSAMFQRDARPGLADPLRWLQDAVMAGHHQLLCYASDRGLADTPRTTVVACVVQGGAACWAHCGDSRLYLVRGHTLLARTRDHSYSELQHALASVVPLAERYNRNVLFTCLGSPGRPIVDVSGPVALQPGDRLLLCSDGLWSGVPDAAIVEDLASGPISETVPGLVDRALQACGDRSDNVTALTVEWEAAEDADSGVSTLQLGDDVFASTIQASMAAAGEVPSDDLDDAEIERSIREINEAIERSARKKR
jgi:serine/threonine protein phosphatase PrpC